MRWMAVSFVVMLAACDISVANAPPEALSGPDLAIALGSEQAAQNFTDVVAAVEPVATQECRRRREAEANCNFLITLDPNRHAPANAFQSEDDAGRPVLTLTLGLIATVNNADELAFVIAHEAAHHISDHLNRQRENAANAAEKFGGLATLTGGNERDVEQAKELGAVVGVRAYSKSFELEADELGTIITYRAGFDPMVGALFFTRIPDPGDQFLGSHPGNAERIDLVARTVKRIEG